MYKKNVWFFKALPLFLFFGLITFFYKDIFNSYFEADEWFHFTYYLPLTRTSSGFFDAFISTIINAGPLSAGQHVIPFGSVIFFLNTKLFGLNYAPYAFMSIFFHVLNSFLVFLFVKEFFYPNKNIKIVAIAFLSGIFFALSQVPMHAVLWAAFYGQNVFSVTLFLMCLLFFKKAINSKKKKYLYLSLLFLLLDLFLKETAATLFLILPIMATIEKKVFSLKYLLKLFMFALLVFTFFRFVVPNMYFGIENIVNRWTDNYIAVAKQSAGNMDTGTIVSTDLSIYKNVYGELLSRTIRFPLKMTSELYFPREIIFSFLQTLTPIIYPLPENVTGNEEKTRVQNYNLFSNGPGNDLIIYMLSIGILLLLCFSANTYFKNKQYEDLRLMVIGLAIVMCGSLPLVLIVLSFPRWGFDTYFDSRHYYMSTVGGAILFPFLLLAVEKFVSKNLIRMRIAIPSYFIITILFLFWFGYNLHAFNTTIHMIIESNSVPRKQVVNQIKEYLPVLPKSAVFYVETDGLGAYGPALPFQTNVAQALTVIYYDKNPLPDEFFASTIFEKTGTGYKFVNGRGFGFYNTKKGLSEALLENKFSTDDVYAFYYHTNAIKLDDITKSTRSEMQQYLEDSKENDNWVVFQDATTKILFRHPASSQVVEEVSEVIDPRLLKKFTIIDPSFTVQLSVVSIAPTFDLNDMQTVVGGSTEAKKIYYDAYHFTDAVIMRSSFETIYFVKFPDKLIRLTVSTKNTLQEKIFEKIIGSISVSE